MLPRIAIKAKQSVCFLMTITEIPPADQRESYLIPVESVHAGHDWVSCCHNISVAQQVRCAT
jgi:hypothetical protein